MPADVTGGSVEPGQATAVRARRSFKYRFYPTPQQAEQLNRTFGNRISEALDEVGG